MSGKIPLLPVLAILCAMVSIQSGASLAKHLFPLIGPTGTTALRLLFASLILTAFWRPWRHMPARNEWFSIAVYGASLAIMNTLFYLAIQRIPLGIAVAFEFTGPLAIALFGSRRLHDLIWVACAVAGVTLLMPLHQNLSALDPIGVAYAFGAALGWALYIIYGHKAGSGMHGGTATALGMVVAALLVFPVSFAQAGPALFAPAVLPFALAVAVFSSAVPYSLEMAALKRLPKRTFSILMSLEPAIAALCGLLYLREQLTLLQWLAIALVMIASAGSTWSARAAESAPEMTA